MFQKIVCTKMKKSAILITDEEFTALWHFWQARDAKEHITCSLCGSFTRETRHFTECGYHPTCLDCWSHAQNSDIRSCPLCPLQPSDAELWCDKCNTISNIKINSATWTCSQCQVLKKNDTTLLRFHKRREKITNFLLKSELEYFLNINNWDILKCPGCNLALERLSACHEMHHCGRQSCCASCGAHSFVWEKNGLHNHRAQTNCSKHIDTDNFAQLWGERDALEIRFRDLVLDSIILE